PLSAAVCVTVSRPLAARVAAALDQQLASLPRRGVARRSPPPLPAVVVGRPPAGAPRVAHPLPPPPLPLAAGASRGPGRGRRAARAGAIFLGQNAPEAFGDYLAGPNHVLPTGGTARFASPLGVYDFVKRTSTIAAGPRTLERLGPAIMRLARLEGLEAHGIAV